MTTADAALLSAACAVLGVVDVAAVGAPSGQKAVHHVQRDGHDLILKVIAIRSTSPTTLTRAEREVTLLKGLTSPHVVRVESDLVTLGNPVSGAAWLEESLDGKDLTDSLGHQWAWGDVADMATQVALGLAAGHANGVIHRDIKPANIRRLSDGSYRVLDFGFARFTLQTGVTVGGQPGTYGYHSPEHLNSYSGAPMPASDVFGVGVLMFEALTGSVPIAFTGDDVDYARRLSRAEIPDLSALRPDLEVDQVELVRRALHAQPARRFRHGQALVDALAGL